MSFWMHNGSLVADETGALIFCDTCPCEDGCNCGDSSTFENIYVDKYATGLGDGSTWENAYTSIHTAITNGYQKIIIVKGYGEDDPYPSLDYYINNEMTAKCRFIEGEGECYISGANGFECSEFSSIQFVNGGVANCSECTFSSCDSTQTDTGSYSYCFVNCLKCTFDICKAYVGRYGFYNCGGTFRFAEALHPTTTTGESYVSTTYGFYNIAEGSTFDTCAVNYLQYGFYSCSNVEFDGVVVNVSQYAFYSCTLNTFADVEINTAQVGFQQCHDATYIGVTLSSVWHCPFYYCYNSSFSDCSASGQTTNQRAGFDNCYTSTFTDCSISEGYHGWSSCANSTFTNCSASDPAVSGYHWGFTSCSNSTFNNCYSDGLTYGFGASDSTFTNCSVSDCYIGFSGCYGATWGEGITVSDCTHYAFDGCQKIIIEGAILTNVCGGFKGAESSQYYESSFTDCSITGHETLSGMGWNAYSYSTYTNCVVDGAGYGFSACTNASFTDCTAENTTSDGWRSCSASTYNSCTATGCNSTGFSESNSCTFIECLSSYNGGSGWSGCWGSTYTECDASYNSGAGLSASSSTFTDCTASNNTSNGFSCSNNLVSMTNCEATDNGTGTSAYNFVQCGGATNCRAFGGGGGFMYSANLNNCYAEGARRPDGSTEMNEGAGFWDCNYITNCETTDCDTGYRSCSSINSCSGHDNVGCGFYNCSGDTSCSDNTQHSLECSGCTAYNNCSTHDPCYVEGEDSDGNYFSENPYSIPGCNSCDGASRDQGFDYDYDWDNYGPCEQ